MVKRVAFMTLGVLKEEWGHPVVQGFVDRIPSVFAAAEAMPGFIARSVRDMGDMTQSWGEIITPKCYGDGIAKRAASTLSLWEDLESVAAYAYHGPHGEAMKHRADWFVHEGLPEHVAWWTEETESLNWQEAADRMDHLYDHGPTPFAFSMRKPFDSNGNAYQIDAARVREMAAKSTDLA
ncbi:MAG: DUF3291 domain-containing protein [Fimbriimonadales bacterium]